ncbi:putative metal-binding motif-containing protein [Bradymonas sediminis]|uniref:Uncharacterized protein n=1 Tax=Bradymonas sediminis TaxID=1548548 RepID=A0A2Z4FMS4_9DELT|nr:putative metal-binding motif-containing protein [Bradymonas sediminis]AWV90125.1 hypothetical protein DN745_12595 [Bradymonas sediminis]TDP75906.1 putative metal-binding protein [Bradymonas sediminis]
MKQVSQYFLMSCILLCLGVVGGCGGDGDATREGENTVEVDGDVSGGGDDAGDDASGDSEQEGDQRICPEEQSFCGVSCVDTQTSADHCGRCDAKCTAPENATASCVEGGCEYQCEAGFSDIDGDLQVPGGTGCERECIPSNGGVEICDGLDNNCDGLVDESFPTLGEECSVGVGACAQTGVYICSDAQDGVVCDATPGEPEDEICGDEIDNNCDGQVDEDEAVDASTWFKDADGDGYGDASLTLVSCSQPAGYVDQDGDCDDTKSGVNPGADEVCDGVDNNCDGQVDEDEAVDAPTWFRDADGDSYGDASIALVSCAQPTGYVDQDGDCDDAKAAVNPGVAEVCDGIDNNCDGRVDEDSAIDASTWFRDADGDGYGLATDTRASCSKPAGYIARDGDCDDTKAAVNPSADEVCDEIDNNCDGRVDEDEAVGAPVWFRDADGDGFGVASSTRASCSQPAGYAGVIGDCKDTDAAVYPGAPGQCDGKDNDCNGEIDEVRLISDSPPSVALAGRVTNSNPPKIMAVPTHEDDSFCAAHLDGTNVIFSRVDAAGGYDSATRTLSGARFILDIDWIKGVGQAPGYCAALIGGTWYNSITQQTLNTLTLAEWSPGNTDITAHDVSPYHEPATSTYGKFSAALYHLTAPSNCTSGCEPYWYVAFVEEKTSSTFRLVTARQVAGYQSDFRFTGRLVVDDSLSQNVDVALGASPKSGDDMMLVWYSTTGNRWQIAGFGDMRGNWAEPPIIYNSVNDPSKRYAHPRIHVSYGFARPGMFPLSDTRYYISLANSYSSIVRVYQIIGQDGTQHYVRGNWADLPMSGNSKYIGRHLMAPNITGVDVNQTAHIGWFIQPYDDHFYRMTWWRGFIQCPFGSCDSRLHFNQFTNPNFDTGDEYLSVRRTDSYIQTLRLTKTNPATVVIDEFTCH